MVGVVNDNQQAERFPMLNRYWSDRAYRKRIDAETEHARRLAQDNWNAARCASGNRWPVDWTEQDKLDATARIEGKYDAH